MRAKGRTESIESSSKHLHVIIMFISIIFIFEAARRAQCIRSIFHRGNLPMISVSKLSSNLRVVVADVMWLPLLVLGDRKGGLRRHQPTTLPRLRGPVVQVPSRENTPQLAVDGNTKEKKNKLAHSKTEPPKPVAIKP
mgnify:CR=1 FL=1